MLHKPSEDLFIKVKIIQFYLLAISIIFFFFFRSTISFLSDAIVHSVVIGTLSASVDHLPQSAMFSSSPVHGD